jgi:hypothetical protein
MAHIITHNLASLPLYQDGFTVGRAVGLRLALDALTAERGRQEQMAADRVKRERGRYVYAEGVLLAVSKTLAAHFRQ